jgi:hypothetical protein
VAGRLVITCRASCTVAAGHRAVSLGAAERHVVYLRPGPQELEFGFDGAPPATRALPLAAGEDVALEIERPAPPRASPPAPLAPPPIAAAQPERPAAPTGLPRAVPIVGGAVALGLAGAAAWSGVDTDRAHTAYVANPTHDAWVSGRAKQLRTNLLFGGAAAVGLAAIAVAALWTRWHDDEAGGAGAALSIAPARGGVALTLDGRF